MKPMIYIKNHATGQEITREMTEEEYEALIASAWTLEPQEETPTE